jgi:hypothetical protein
MKLTLQVTAVFAIIILGSFIPDALHNFFGDWFCKGRVNGAGCDEGESYSHLPQWHYGYRHVMWILMNICLFIIQAFRIGMFIKEKNQKI